MGPDAVGIGGRICADGTLAGDFPGRGDQPSGVRHQSFGRRLATRCPAPVATTAEQNGQRAAIVTGPELLAHVTAGRIPNPVFMSIILGVLTRSAQFVKCASGGSLLPRLFAHSLYEAEPKLAACLEIAEWRGGADRLNLVTEVVLAGIVTCGFAVFYNTAWRQIGMAVVGGMATWKSS